MANKISGKVQIGPPKILAAVAWRLIPATFRQQLWADFLERYQSPRLLLHRTAKAINGAVLSQVREPGYGSLAAAEACILYIALCGALQPASAIVLAVTVSGALVVRDGYMDRRKRGYVCFLWDAVAATALLAGLQLLTLGAEAPAMAAQAVVGGVAVSFFRLIFRMPEDPRQRVFDEYRDTLQINVLWMVACEALMLTSLDAVAAHMPGRDAFFAGAPIAAWGLALRLRSDSLGGVRKEPLLSLRVNPLKQEAALKRDSLIVPSSLTLPQCFEVLFFVLMAAPLAIAAWRWATGQDSDVDWFQVGANAGALLILTVFWIKIRKLNAETVKGLKNVV